MSAPEQSVNASAPKLHAESPAVPAPPASTAAAPDAPSDTRAALEKLAKTLLHVAWMAILLGLTMQILGVLIQGAFGKAPQGNPVIADSVQKVSWSLFVCTGLAIGTAAARARGASMGFAGFLSAPLSFAAAKSLQKSTQMALGISSPVPAVVINPMLLAGIKAFEYLCLGVALAYVGKKPTSGIKQFALTGLIVGLTFGGTVLGILIRAMLQAKQINALVLASTAVNEILFPVGCSMVIYAAQSLGSFASKAAK